jgi:hypothetical protein
MTLYRSEYVQETWVTNYYFLLIVQFNGSNIALPMYYTEYGLRYVYMFYLIFLRFFKNMTATHLYIYLHEPHRRQTLSFINFTFYVEFISLSVLL